MPNTNAGGDAVGTEPVPAAPRVGLTARARLRRPTGVMGRVRWDFVLTIAIMHLLALLALDPTYFSWLGVISLVVGVHVFGQGINLCYHRQLTHRAFRTPVWLERFFAIVAMCCLEGPPGRWVATHRFHHNHSDEQEDPHSPLVDFLWGHVGWLVLRNRTTQNVNMYHRYARDILSDDFYRRHEKGFGWLIYFVGYAAALFTLGLTVGWAWQGQAAAGLRLGASLVVWGVIVRTVVVWHFTWSVNSLTHLFGYRNYETGENSRNNWLVALLTVGEGWHNNHHADPAAASVQRRWWEIDITYYQIKLLELLGLAWDVVPPRHVRAARSAARRATAA